MTSPVGKWIGKVTSDLTLFESLQLINVSSKSKIKVFFPKN